jgi:high-affinity nickel-transport protein
MEQQRVSQTPARARLSIAERRRLAGFAAAILCLHIAGFGLLLTAIHSGAGALIGLGTGLTAYSFGLRHAFDADHIAAIDNTTRKLLSQGQRPLGVGFFFSLGHSTIVLGLSAALAIAARAAAGTLQGNSSLRAVGGLVGTSVSALFLYLIGIINLLILIGIVRVFRNLRRGRYQEDALEEQLQRRGLMNRVLGRFTRSVGSSRRMYPVGVMFGLGFDTATEVGLLALSAGAAAGGLPWYATMSLPILFAAGMCLMDTADGMFMSVAYGWAFSNPLRKVFYNMSITALSVVVALLIGSIEILSILAKAFRLRGGVWDLASALNLNQIGYFVVALFVVTWAGAVVIWKVGKFEDRWA